MVDVSTEARNKVKVSVTKIHQNNNVNKTLLQLICISTLQNDEVVKISMT